MQPAYFVRSIRQFLSKIFSRQIFLLEPHEAYQLWAATYDDAEDNALLFAESRALRRYLEPSLIEGKDVLDAGCGTGRYLPLLQDFHPRTIAAADPSSNMIEKAKTKITGLVPISLHVGTVEQLPFRDESFDFILCTLVLGHVEHLMPAMTELSRVLRRNGTIIISCFHPFGRLLGWQRTFQATKTFAVKYYTHLYSEYFEGFSRTGLALLRMEEPVIDESLFRFYEKAGRTDMYERYKGYPILLIFEVRKK